MYPNSLTFRFPWTLLSLVCFAVLLAACQPVHPEPTGAAAVPAIGAGHAVKPTDPVEVQIANAMSAGPMGIAKDATIMGFPVEAGGAMVVLRKGTNDWTCFTDWPDSPGNDPMCGDPVFVGWNDALGGGAPQPDIPKVGIGYMLQGGSDPSNTDPADPMPARVEDWIESPPHVHPLLPGGYVPGQFTTNPTSGYPFVMWDGNPYAHLHVSVNLTPFDEPDPKIRDAMRAAPLAIAKDATIVDYPPEGQTEPTVLRQGTTGWTCWIDWAVTPADDPKCLDETWTKWREAVATGADFTTDRLGIGFMLQGGASASNTDPMALTPPAGAEWQIDPPALMFLVPDDLNPADFSTDPKSGGPSIRFEGTPYEYLMVPVQTGE